MLAYVLENADPVHKVTILPTGMALGVTHQLPMEERHIHAREYIEDSLCVRMGGRVAELLVYGDLSTGAANDLVGNTELARKMVREWGMSDAIGPMAWGSRGQVFLGEDLMHTRDYSEDTSKVIDDEVERILRAEEARAMEVLSKHRGGLNAIARALLDNESINGAEVARLVDEAHGVARARRGRQVGPALQRGGPHRARQQRFQWQRKRQRAARRDRRLCRPRQRSRARSAPGDGRHSWADQGRWRCPATRPSPRHGLPRPGPRRSQPGFGRSGGTRSPLLHGSPPVRTGWIEPIRVMQRHEGGWWSTNSRTGSRTATWRPSVRPA